MSLLMDALKRAEASKRTAGDVPQPLSTGDNEPRLTLEELPSALAPKSTSNDTSRLELSNQLDDIEADLETNQAGAAGVSPHRFSAETATTSEESQRQLAKKVMALKDNAAPPKVWRRRAPFLAVSGMLCLVGAGVGVYFWNELERITQPNSGLALRGGTASNARPILTAPITAPAPVIVQEPTLASAAAAAVEPPAGAAPAAEATTTNASKTIQPTEPTARPAAESPKVFRSRLATPPVETKRTQPAPDNTQLAFQALNSGDREAAATHYQAALAADARNLDALIGLASLAAARGESMAAENYYLRAIEADPKSALAQSGLINLHGKRDPAFAESRLKVLATGLPPGSPASGSVLFALGNLFAAQSRWNEAQRAYFEAYGADASNPDYQMNLAVALEHLQKPALALNFYRGALRAAEQRPASFDRQQVKERIDVLQSASR